MKKETLLIIGLLIVSLMFCQFAQAQTTGFTYQGSLKNGVAPASGNHDFEFALFDAASGGTQLGSTNSVNGVAVIGGVFSVQLNFGSNFPGANRFLEIRVRQSGGGGFTTLTPRQVVTSAPYSVKSLTAETAVSATNSLQLGGVAANQFVLTGDTRLSDARQPLAGSSSYIQNSTTLQPATNFNISGNGTVGGTLNASRMNVTGGFSGGYNIGSQPVLTAMDSNLIVGFGAGMQINPTMATDNSFFGTNAGAANTTGIGNSFFGKSAGAANTIGDMNAFFGINAGRSNTTGRSNSFVGNIAGFRNTTGINNTFVGTQAGTSNTTGSGNSFVGAFAGRDNTIGDNNAFFGNAAGIFNTTGTNNSFFGVVAGRDNTTGAENVFVGLSAGQFNTTGNFNSIFGTGAGDINTTGSNNTIIGYNADVGSGNLTYATAIGSDAVVSTSNTIMLGRIADTVIAPNLLQVNILGAAGSTSLCRNALNQISTCTAGNLLEGSGNENAATLNELRTQLKQQQELLDKQQSEIKKQQSEIDALKTLVCSQNPTVQLCKSKN